MPYGSGRAAQALPLRHSPCCGSRKPQSLLLGAGRGVLSAGTASGSSERSTLYSGASICLVVQFWKLPWAYHVRDAIAVFACIVQNRCFTKGIRCTFRLSSHSSTDASVRSLSAGNSSSETETSCYWHCSSEAFSAETLSGFSVCAEPSASFPLDALKRSPLWELLPT